MLTISELFVYPVKSLGGISVSSAYVTERGLEHDRRWMLVDSKNRFMTQREFPSLALLQVSIIEEGLQVMHKHNHSAFTIPFHPQTNSFITVEVWSDTCKAQLVSEEADKWFSEMLSFPCRLVFMPDATRRRVDSRYAFNKEITSFSDGYPMLLIGQSSLDDLNNKLTESISINRFRPNIVFTGGEPFEEDILEHFIINNINFYGVKPCARCVITTIDQKNAIKGREPLKTLASYRGYKNKIYFGQNLLHHGEGIIKVDDKIEVIKRKKEL
ncbi:MAG TPA: MOSC N-terminal beta barrel domain-containing protein [Chitinophagaceae bacterium]|nr:MOSC N-terminal beta barrel domain-containing protein [Chitinophagaceae bacterium]